MLTFAEPLYCCSV